METNRIELTPEQKGVLAALSQETGEPVSALIDKALEELQERLRARRENGTQERDRKEKAPKPIWEEIIEASSRIPDEELEDLPTDLAANVDHYVYGLPKRTS
jgi:hypothetical protein